MGIDMELKGAVHPHRESFDVPRDFPSMKSVMEAIPAECFKRSLAKSMSYAVMSVVLVVATGLLATRFLPVLSVRDPLSIVLWALYAALNGTIATGAWVAAHECGHGAFCDNKVVQDATGFILHSLLLVPYFSWQRSHAVHHSRTNHMTEGETHVPETVEECYKVGIHSWIGEDAFAIVNLFAHLVVGWPAYLLTGATGGPSRGITNHFVPGDSLFPGEWKAKVLASDVGILATLTLVYFWTKTAGFMPVLGLYWMPYLVVNFWLVLYTWLQHTDVDIPHYGPNEWTWIKGAFSTVDRPYPAVIDFLHHRIGSTHVAHHISSKIPHYNARQATDAIKKNFPEFYLYDPTPLPQATWRVACKCVAVTNSPDDPRYFYTNKGKKE